MLVWSSAFRRDPELLTSIQDLASFRSLSFTARLSSGIPNEGFQIAAACLVELHALAFQHALLFVSRQYNARRGCSPLRIDHAMPWRLVIGAMHDESNCARRITFAEHVSNLPVSHHAATRNATNDFVNALAIFRIGLLLDLLHARLQNRLR